MANEQACAAQHFGMWAVKPAWLNAVVSAYNAGALPKVEFDENDQRMYSVDSTGIATISISGQILKGWSSYGGTSSIATRQALRQAEADQDVRAIMLAIDSPGGTVAGIKALADEVARIRREGVKPIVTHAEDSMHSAALWVGVQASRVTASAMTEVGSIGTLAVVEDTSKMAESIGIKVHVISSGEMKGAGVPGTEITEDMLAEVQERVDQINAFFLNAVKKGRGTGIDEVRRLADGRDWLAAEARERNLIDEVMSQDDAVRMLRSDLRQRDRERQAVGQRRSRSIKIEELS